MELEGGTRAHFQPLEWSGLGDLGVEDVFCYGIEVPGDKADGSVHSPPRGMTGAGRKQGTSEAAADQDRPNVDERLFFGHRGPCSEDSSGNMRMAPLTGILEGTAAA